MLPAQTDSRLVIRPIGAITLVAMGNAMLLRTWTVRWLVSGSLGLILALPAWAERMPMPELQRLVQRANTLLQGDQEDEAARVIDEAMKGAEQWGAESAPVASVLMLRMGLQLKRSEIDAAAASGKQAVAISDKAFGADSPLSSMACLMVSAVYTLGGRPAMAEPWERRYLTGMEAMDPDGLSVATALNALATTEKALGHFGAADQHLQRALKIQEKHRPARNSDSIRLLLAFGDLKALRGDHAAAQAAYQRALDFKPVPTSAPQPVGGDMQLQVTRAYLGLGRHDEAAEAVARATAAVDANTPAGKGRLVQVLRASARVDQARSRPAQAEQALRRALAITEELHGAGNANLPPILIELGDLLSGGSDAALSEQPYREALGQIEHRFGPSHADMAPALLGLGRLQLAAGQLAPAEASFKRLVTLHETHIASDHPQVADALDGLAEVLRATSREAEARAAIERAEAIRSMTR